MEQRTVYAAIGPEHLAEVEAELRKMIEERQQAAAYLAHLDEQIARKAGAAEYIAGILDRVQQQAAAQPPAPAPAAEPAEGEKEE